MNDEFGTPYDFDIIDEVKKPELKKPPMFAIILHNDDTTDFLIVIHALIGHIGLDHSAAMNCMSEAHFTGKSACGTFTKEIAETKVQSAMNCPAVGGSELSFTIEAV